MGALRVPLTSWARPSGTWPVAARPWPAGWLAIPVELVVETLAVAAVEMKLIAELHEVYGRPVPGRGRDRGLLLARAWAEGRGVSATALATPTGLSALLSVGARRQAAQL